MGDHVCDYHVLEAVRRWTFRMKRERATIFRILEGDAEKGSGCEYCFETAKKGATIDEVPAAKWRVTL